MCTWALEHIALIDINCTSACCVLLSSHLEFFAYVRWMDAHIDDAHFTVSNSMKRTYSQNMNIFTVFYGRKKTMPKKKWNCSLHLFFSHCCWLFPIPFRSCPFWMGDISPEITHWFYETRYQYWCLVRGSHCAQIHICKVRYLLIEWYAMQCWIHTTQSTSMHARAHSSKINGSCSSIKIMANKMRNYQFLIWG